MRTANKSKKCNARKTVLLLALTPINRFTGVWSVMATILLLFFPQILSTLNSFINTELLNLTWEYRLIWFFGVTTYLFWNAATTIQIQVQSDEERADEKQKIFKDLESNIKYLNNLREAGIEIQSKCENLLIEKSEFEEGFGIDRDNFAENRIEMVNWMNDVLKYLEEHRNTRIFLGKFKMLGRFKKKDVVLDCMFAKDNKQHKEAQELEFHLVRLDRLDTIIDKLENKLLSL